jgi:hypothetical protein
MPYREENSDPFVSDAFGRMHYDLDHAARRNWRSSRNELSNAFLQSARDCCNNCESMHGDEFGLQTLNASPSPVNPLRAELSRLLQKHHE